MEGCQHERGRLSKWEQISKLSASTRHAAKTQRREGRPGLQVRSSHLGRARVCRSRQDLSRSAVIRDVEKSDHSTLEAVHLVSGLDYVFPDLNDSLFIVKVTDGHHGLAVKLEGTVYLWLDHGHGTPEERWQIFHELVEEAKKQAWAKGLDTLTCVVPPEMQKSFDKRLREIGMTLDRSWPKYSYDLTQYVPVESGDSSDKDDGSPSVVP